MAANLRNGLPSNNPILLYYYSPTLRLGTILIEIELLHSLACLRACDAFVA